MALQGGVIIIGSLLWDENNERPLWRTQRLNETAVRRVALPIRYGRFSDHRRAYTMVFSRLCYRHKQLGQGVIVPFSRPIESFSGLQQEVDALGKAEGLDSNWQWGAVGLLPGASCKCPANLLQQWTQYFRARTAHYEAFAGHTRTEQPTISRDGFLNLRWPLSGKAADRFDFLLATPTKARIENQPSLRRYPNSTEIAKSLPADTTDYFINNFLRGIRTQQDAAIWRTVARVQPRFAAEWPQISDELEVFLNASTTPARGPRSGSATPRTRLCPPKPTLPRP